MIFITKIQEVIREKFISIGSLKNNQIQNLFKKVK